MMSKLRIFLSAVLLSLPALAAAHPGHGHASDGFGLLHYLTEPIHVLFVLGILGSFLLALTCYKASARLQGKKAKGSN